MKIDKPEEASAAALGSVVINLVNEEAAHGQLQGDIDSIVCKVAALIVKGDADAKRELLCMYRGYRSRQLGTGSPRGMTGASGDLVTAAGAWLRRGITGATGAAPARPCPPPRNRLRQHSDDWELVETEEEHPE